MTQDTQIDIPSLEEFPLWLKDRIDVDIDSSHIIHYNNAIVRMKEQLEQSSFWKLLCGNIIEVNDEYFGEYQTELLKERKAPSVSKKESSSFIDKVYRENIINNLNLPDEPDLGWVTPENWFTKINDIMRTRIVVKYLDGVEYLASRLETLCCEESKIRDKCRYIARIDGYYAAHLYFDMEFEIPGMKWDTERVNSSVEIQITTQIKEVIGDLLHIPYEKRRLIRSPEEDIWQWQYNSPEFATNYLGHIIHYVEGMMVGIRKGDK